MCYETVPCSRNHNDEVPESIITYNYHTIATRKSLYCPQVSYSPYIFLHFPDDSATSSSSCRFYPAARLSLYLPINIFQAIIYFVTQERFFVSSRCKIVSRNRHIHQNPEEILYFNKRKIILKFSNKNMRMKFLYISINFLFMTI